jgi:hypothetical protein
VKGGQIDHRNANRLGAMFIAALLANGGAFFGESAGAVPDFDRQVAPLLARRCLGCHNGDEFRGKLDLTGKAAAMAGGESGPVIVPGNPDESLLWNYVDSDEMPPKKPLPATEKALLKAWIAYGAAWGMDPVDPFRWTTEVRAGYDWWALQPVRRPAIPVGRESGAQRWEKNAIDLFVAEKLARHELSPAGEAERRVLIRRLTFDLLGLPPAPAEIENFERDEAPDAYERLVDRLLASGRHGERWARHWLDVVRYTESDGFEYDRIRPNAWHYRDYVVHAFNTDKPYDQFVREQLAGDAIRPVTRDTVIATSLLVCGPFDVAGSGQANATQRAITREEEMEDLVSVVAQTFVGMTLNCARCHAHKFDPLSQADYYRFKSALDGVRHGEGSIDTPAERKARDERIARLNKERRLLEQQLAELETTARRAVARRPQRGAPARQPAPRPAALWTFDADARDTVGSLHGTLHGGATIADGRLKLDGKNGFVRTDSLARDIQEKTLEAWVALASLDQGGGGVISIEDSQGREFDAIVFGERQKRKWTSGSTGFARTRDLDARQESFQPGELIHVAAVYAADNTIKLYRNGQPYGESYSPASSLPRYRAGDARLLIGMRHTGGGNPFLAGEIEQAALYDRALTADEIAASYQAAGLGVTRDQWLASLSPDDRQRHDALAADLSRVLVELKAVPPVAVSYVGKREKVGATRRLVRGDVKNPAEAIPPGGLSCLKSVPDNFALSSDADEALRRIKLAEWMTDPRNPLTARVMANRVWHYHFGQGIVGTPSDFGFNGDRPSHPALLDYLAATLVQNGWSLKQLHKLMVTSAAYRQSAANRADAATRDGDNRLLWRFAPRRLEGEAVRDAMLFVSGQMNWAMGGPSFRPFDVTTHGSDFYQLKDKLGEEFNRRTIYRINVNSGKSPLMDALDCPDPSVKTPLRRVTTTPLQALALMNNSFVQRQAKYFAERVLRGAASDVPRAVDAAYRSALGRGPTGEEHKTAVAHARRHGMENLCWVLLNATELMYVE